MILKIIIFLLTTFFLFAKTLFGQAPPPPMAMPADSNIILIDKIIEVSNHEKYFVEYCTKKVRQYSIENNWTAEKTNQIMESIKFKSYKTTIYNSYAFYSIEQLKSLYDTLALVNKDTKSSFSMILTNSMMQNNLDLLVDGLIEGKYITSK